MGALKSKFRRSKSRSDKPNDGSVKTSRKQSKKKTVNLPESQSARKTVDPRLPFSNYRQIFSIRNAWKAIQRSMEECAKETFVSFLTKNGKYRAVFTEVKDLKDGDLETLRYHEDFELKAMNMFNIFDDVITNLEEVNKALRTIEYDAEPTEFTAKMLKAYHDPFIETIKWHLGSDRFTEATENNFEQLYQFVYDEMLKYVRDDSAEPDDYEKGDSKVENDVVEPDIPNIDADVHAEADAAEQENENEAKSEKEAGNENKADNENETHTIGNDSTVIEDTQIELSLCGDEKS